MDIIRARGVGYVMHVRCTAAFIDYHSLCTTVGRGTALIQNEEQGG